MKEITSAEWQVMECLWEKSPQSGREITETLTLQMNWSRSTVLTMLRRMTEKGLIAKGEEKGIAVYSPLAERESAAERETESFLNRVYRGSVSLMMSAMTEKERLTSQEIDALYAILEEAKRHV